MNEAATDDIVETMVIDGSTLAAIPPFPVDVAILRGSWADGSAT